VEDVFYNGLTCYDLERTFTEKMGQDLAREITDPKKIDECLRSRGNMSSPGLDELTNPILKMEREITAEALSELFKIFIAAGKVPTDWKHAKTVLIFKGGDPNLIENWRPITITSVIYRVLFCRVSRALSQIYEVNGNKVCDDAQKGFVNGRAGCQENIADANAIIEDAVRKKKKLYSMYFDLRDAFGSIPHTLIKKNLMDIGMPPNLVRMIMSAYAGATIRVKGKEGYTRQVEIKKGVKQGCPLSPTLFNLAMDPLLRDIRKNHQFRGYRYDAEITRTIQAYADDLTVFSEDEDNFRQLNKVVIEYMRYARLSFNPNKCVIMINDPDKRNREDFVLMLPDEAGKECKIKVCRPDETVKYLGVPLSTKRFAKLDFAQHIIDKQRMNIERFMASGLKISQLIHGFKTFINSALDYVMANSICRRGDLDKVDLTIRKGLNEIIGKPATSVNLFYTKWTDGGLCLKSMVERYDILKINNMPYYYLKNDETRMFITKLMDVKMKARGAYEKDPNEGEEFFNWNMSNGVKSKGCYHSMIGECIKACHRLNIGIDYDTGTNRMKLWDMDHEPVFLYRVQVARTLSDWVASRHRLGVENQSVRGESMCTLINSPCSNFMIGNCRAPVKDYVVRFIIKGRNQTLWTPAYQTMIYRNKGYNALCSCVNHRPCNIAHILNNCGHNFGYMTARHNKVVGRLVEAICHFWKLKEEEIRKNRQMDLGDKWSELSQIDCCCVGKDGPDIVFWTVEKGEGTETRTLHIVEVAVPYGKFDQEKKESTLVLRAREKTEKYNKWIPEIERQLEEYKDNRITYKTTYQVILVSSLGAVPDFTIKAFGEMLGGITKSDETIWGKRLAMDAINGSLELWMHTKEGVFSLMRHRRNELYGETLQEIDEQIEDTKYKFDKAKRKIVMETLFSDMNLDEKAEEETDLERIKEGYDVDQEEVQEMVEERVESLFITKPRVIESYRPEEEAEGVEVQKREEEESDAIGSSSESEDWFVKMCEKIIDSED
jgi:hypothetical protein